MGRMVRKQFYIDEDLESALERYSAESGLPQAALVRTALERFLQEVREEAARSEAWGQVVTGMEEAAALPPRASGRTWKREDAYPGER